MTKILRAVFMGLGLLAGGVLLSGCASTGLGGKQALRVGVTPDYPPMIYQEGRVIDGLEADFAEMLAEELGQYVQFVPLRWEDQISAMMRNDIDIVMSGMSVTVPRQMRVQFTEPWLETGLMAMFRKSDIEVYASPKALHGMRGTVGFKTGTTGETYVRKHFPNASYRPYRVPADATIDLRRNRLDVFVHDAPGIAWLVSANEAELTALFALLTRDKIAWALPLKDNELAPKVSKILARWKKDGTLEQMLDFWLPYRKLFDQPAE